MKLIVGLGNPDPKYETTRHNAGFLIVDKLADEFGITLSKSRFEGDLGRGRLLKQDCCLLKPMTYMNLSGRCVSQVARFYKVSEDELIVIHDDVDVPAGKVKARIGGSDGGHNGIKSIIAETGFREFHRIKVGVGRPETREQGQVKNWVLNQFNDEELDLLVGDVYDQVLLRLDNILKRN